MAGAVLALTEDSTLAVGYLFNDTFAIQQGANVSCIAQITIPGGSGAFAAILIPGSGYIVQAAPMVLIPAGSQPTSGTGMSVGIAAVSAADTGYRNKFYVMK